MACACLMTVSCQNNEKENTPEAATERFAKAFYTADFPHMYQYTTKRSEIVVQQIQTAMKENPENLDKMKSTKVEFVETTVQGQTDSTAICACSLKLDGEPLTSTWELLKEDDLWKVTLVLP